MGLLLKKQFVHDSTYKIPFSECYVRIENYTIRNNPAFLHLTVRYFKSKADADSNDRIPDGKMSPITGVLDPYNVLETGELVKWPVRFSIPLVKENCCSKLGLRYDIGIITELYTQSYAHLKNELQKEFEDLVIEDL